MTLTRRARRKEHMKYLEEYSVRTEDDEDDPSKISPRSDLTSYNNSVRSKTDSSYGIDNWSADVGHTNNNNDIMDGSLPMSSKRKAATYDHNDEHGAPELVTNIDDVKL